jgi:hypothetical protein
LAVAFYLLGYHVTGYITADDEDIKKYLYKTFSKKLGWFETPRRTLGDVAYFETIEKYVYDTAFDIVDRFDAVQDTPWPILYKELDQRYPGSKFILTIRDTDKWFNSVIKHFKGHKIPMHQWIYGVPKAKGYKNAYIKRYEAHNRDVIEYFKDRPNDLLVMDITKGDGWEKLCPFLGKEIPPVSFPKQNTSSQKSRQLWQRSKKFLEKTAIPNSIKKALNMRDRVNVTYVQDILHYHYKMYEIVWQGIDALTHEQLALAMDSPFGHHSIQNLLFEQMNHEAAWLSRFQGESIPLSDDPQSIPLTKDKLKKTWHKNEVFMRKYTANLTNELCNSKTPNGEGLMWEAYVDIMTKGIENRFVIRTILLTFGIDVKEPSFSEFFNTK